MGEFSPAHWLVFIVIGLLIYVASSYCWLGGHWQARSRKIANVVFSSSTLDE
jgi:hypothetical protein